LDRAHASPRSLQVAVEMRKLGMDPNDHHASRPLAAESHVYSSGCCRSLAEHESAASGKKRKTGMNALTGQI
jgi:hypothetical protein